MTSLLQSGVCTFMLSCPPKEFDKFEVHGIYSSPYLEQTFLYFVMMEAETAKKFSVINFNFDNCSLKQFKTNIRQHYDNRHRRSL